MTHYIYLYGTSKEVTSILKAIGSTASDKSCWETLHDTFFPPDITVYRVKVVTRRNIDKIYQSLKALVLPYALWEIKSKYQANYEDVYRNPETYDFYTNFSHGDAMLALKQRYALYNERDESGKLSAFSWPGGYDIYYLDNKNNVFCADCANDIDAMGYTWLVAYDILEEGTTYCDGCSKVIFEDEYEESESE